MWKNNVISLIQIKFVCGKDRYISSGAFCQGGLEVCSSSCNVLFTHFNRLDSSITTLPTGPYLLKSFYRNSLI